ncbi:hypothetical protein BaRGS_00038667, partial [Batillaria attramentaria]
DASLGGGVEDVTEPVQHCVMDLVRETMETDVSAVRVTSLLHFVLRVWQDIMVSSVINSVVTTVCLTTTGENLALRPMDADAGQDISGHNVKLSVDMAVSTKLATDKMAHVNVRPCGLRQIAQNAKTVISERSRANLVVAVVTTPSVTTTTGTVLKDVLTVMAEICVTQKGHETAAVESYSAKWDIRSSRFGVIGPAVLQEAAPGGSSGSDVGAIAGGVVGGVGVVVAVALLVVFIVFRRRRSSKGSGTRGVDEAADLARADTLSSSQATNVSADQSPKAAKAKKPKAQIKPFNRAETKAEEQGGSASHVYSNTAAVVNPTAAETSSQLAAGENPAQSAASTSTGAGDRPAKTKSKPSTAPKPAAAKGAGREDLYGSFKSLSSAQLDAFQRYLIACLGSGELGDQFENLPKGMRHPHTIGLSEENKRKNRFKALCTYDFNRVVLRRPKGDKSSDYINATYIKGYQRDQQYIATQGPRANTTDDLWWMVWQEGITQIVMLANLQEDGRDKCEEYWPASGKSQTYGHVTVKGLEEQQRADFVIRSFVLKNAKSSGERHVTQYHYMAWPDHGVPLAASLVDYWRYVKARSTSTVPLLVHCSAGVGRTGTFIALDIASEKKSRGDDVNVNEIVTQLREQRALMVQSEAQYKFLHEVILEAHTSRATRVSTGQFDDIFPDTIQTNTNNSRIDSEFQ